MRNHDGQGLNETTQMGLRLYRFLHHENRLLLSTSVAKFNYTHEELYLC
jgi:hypothetical protein